jgi:peptidoglycan/LPS O-acetylase OafA/YrhL
MIEISINTPALLFPAITLLMLAYTNRFLSLAALVRSLHGEYHRGERKKNILKQIKNIRSRINLIRYMQALGVLSFLCCVLCMYTIYRNWMPVSNLIFACSLLFLALSIILSLVEINKSTKAIELVLGDIEELNKENIFKDIFKKGEN